MKAIGRSHTIGAVALGAGLLLGASGMSVAQAADLGGDCCADLEERVAELEQTTVRKGNRRVSVELTGAVNRALLFWDDGDESNVNEGDNTNDTTNFQLAGDAEIRPGWSAGYVFLFFFDGTSTATVNQIDDDGGTQDDQALVVREVNWWIESERLGRLTLGRASDALDGVPEADLSGTGVIGYAGVADIGGGFFLRRSDIAGSAGLLTDVTWGDMMVHLNGDLFEIVRYDTPEFGGFQAAVTWGEDDQWAVSLTYAKSMNSVEVEAKIGYGEDRDTEPDAQFAESDAENTDTLVGSISAIHKPSGLNLTFAAGHRDFNHFLRNNDNVLRRKEDASFWYGKLGILKRLNALGETGFYGEMAQFHDFISNDASAALVDSLDLDTAAACAGAGNGCLVTGNEANMWGIGLVQHIDNAAMQLYIGYRHYEVDFDLVDVNLASVPTAPLEDFDVITVGGRIEF